MNHSDFVNKAMKVLPGQIVHDSNFDPIRVQTRKWCRQAWEDNWPERFSNCCKKWMELLPLDSYEFALVNYCKVREDQIARKGKQLMEPEEGQDGGQFGKGLTLTGLWKRTSQDGKTYLHGYFGLLKIMIFQNMYKSKDTDPDYNVVIAPKPPKQENKPETDGFGI